MTRPDATDPFTRLKPFDRYPGMTKLPLGSDRELVCLGTGPEVDAALRDAAKERGRG